MGESQILGQVKDALTLCQAHGTVGTVLNSLFQQAIRVGKRVQTETGIGSAGRSLVTAAYELLTAERGALAGRRVLVVGAGAMAGLAARTAAADGASVSCANRTLARAERLAEAVGGARCRLHDLPQALGRDRYPGHLHRGADAYHRRGRSGRYAGARHRRSCLPADVAPEVCEHGISLVNLDRLVTDQPDVASAAEIEDARDLVRGRGGPLPRLAPRGPRRPDRRRLAVHGLRRRSRRTASARGPAAAA